MSDHGEFSIFAVFSLIQLAKVDLVSSCISCEPFYALVSVFLGFILEWIARNAVQHVLC